jgi:hypothetical protein
MALIPLLLATALCLFSWWYPWKTLHTPLGLIALQLPWIAVPLAWLYNDMMRVYTIRIDLHFLGLPAIAVAITTFWLYLLRMVRVVRHLCRRDTRGFEVVGAETKPPTVMP